MTLIHSRSVKALHVSRLLIIFRLKFTFNDAIPKSLRIYFMTVFSPAIFSAFGMRKIRYAHIKAEDTRVRIT